MTKFFTGDDPTLINVPKSNDQK